MKELKEETIGQRIKAQRIRCGMTQEILAERMFIPKSTISAYENDKVDIKASVIVDLARELETDPNYLLGQGALDADIVMILNVLKSVSRPAVKRVILGQINVLLSVELS